MRKEILLIRHAQSANNALPESQRVPDPGLTEKGSEQSQRLADWLATIPLTHVYCSGFRRALDTTVPIAEKTGLIPEVRHDLFEQGGCYSGFPPNELVPCPGMSHREIMDGYPNWRIDQRIGQSGWWHGQKFESDEEAVGRARNVLHWIEQLEHVAMQAVLVVHADFKRLLLSELLQPHVDMDRLGPIFNTSATHLVNEQGRWRLETWNSISHLPSRLITK